jgi:hypothetical protein
VYYKSWDLIVESWEQEKEDTKFRYIKFKTGHSKDRTFGAEDEQSVTCPT